MVIREEYYFSVIEVISALREESPQGLKENLKVSKRGGGVAKGAKYLYEKETKKSAISKSNSLNYKYIDEVKQIQNKEGEIDE